MTKKNKLIALYIIIAIAIILLSFFVVVSKRKNEVVVYTKPLTDATSTLFAATSSTLVTKQITKKSVVTKSTTPSNTTNTSQTSNQASIDVNEIDYTDAGFVPRELKITHGQSIKFVNKSSGAMRIFSDDTSNAKATELNQSKAIGKGGVYTFNFIYEGVWNYHNQLDESKRGSVIVN